ncbi:SMI1/KNR4 family protein [Listeria seeligeri]|uniref:SMI1/KNR4 family protein n=1 Tax=Listeria seeligeri TaxID=1640 RepID=UPI001629A1B9|nr:SMI1/KNR4 family protein [Listeria seeligeri]MBC1425627.1 SMI1/KNR4 family protein [Listeria seeligeri]MBC1777191.1 SMI1/KNR4 family protein [Listeria seeligeri]MBC1828329.1 SMI1/KNR4 family protein [Listeria seeligeri]MBC6121692.1 SMI1/KNR4 family protein [Listeria seeligeri]MBC6144623.1 SMI1/KNR4 family protein [Listeria seeligeri]
MKYEFFTSNPNNSFYSVSVKEIEETEKVLDLKIPKELKEFFLNVGYGFIKGSKYNVNRIMGPLSIMDFRLKKNDFEFFPDIEIYDELENEIIFFEANETALISIKLSEEEKNEIYYDEFKIADSLEEFLIKISENDLYYMDLID